MRAVTVAVIFAGLVSFGWVSTPPQDNGTHPIYASPQEAAEDDPVPSATEPASLPSDPDDDEDEDRVKPRRQRRYV